ncbi:TonB system transport protein ExbD [Campylobacter hyointestinalis subsp. lawsonii]|uniref:Biopolymer transport protein ExbD n=1 Tax=Campylobacter hyointestinalis subsp. lawsonii TaxID=91353 RepID=A0AAV6EI94_CAMHY|nr:TonB system transport protein ExbD [Campylobacter hyointestinalis subsp. lawsonii CCUG 27631]KAB0614267.1 TonB system transport protein ExbD [Campylobacter hyointestinalis subsp. lawsonii]MBT0612280.1 TonB system transport protein ExbD [Campylobacter hyointestinalis subsp. hyointestinalis]QKF70015.1 TonB system transport protein ExbD [Campylobacter hyointestinalis subsp. lawsonii]RAZ24708.1 TonB system transport protein ExbD [Campylobacter hyointestinalis subsp. lawsonii]
MRLPKNDGLNIVPFIDIMLVLLCIVLSISTFITSGHIKLSLPNADSSIKNIEKSQIVISVDKENNLYFNDRLVDKEALKNEIFKLENSDFIEIKSDKESKFETFVWIIDILKEKNHENFSIVTKND